MDGGGSPFAVAISPDGNSAYVTNGFGADAVFQFDVGTGGVLTPKSPPAVATGDRPFGVAVSPVSAQGRRPGKGCGDKNHVHEREDECKKPPT